MRVIAGEHGGRRLHAPPGRRTRPTSDRVREALFSSLAPRLPGARVLDLYAGSGALGIEALSRGAAGARFVERHPATARVAVRNLAELGLDGGDAAVVTADVTDVRSWHLAGARYDLVLVDPPYADAPSAAVAVLGELAADGAVRPASPVDTGTLVVLEQDRRRVVELPGWLAVVRSRTYGDTTLHFIELREDPPT